VTGLLEHEASVRLYVLIAGFGVIAVWEALMPRRRPAPPARGRWPVNIGLTLLLSVITALVFPLLAVGTAVAVERAGFGWFNATRWPAALEFVLAFAVLDIGRYAQHVLLHRVPALWSLHRVHHSDTDYDSTTALRFHPLEALLTVGAHLAVIALLGAPPVAVLAYEVATVLVALFSHGNIALPTGLDRWLRWIVVTPDMHRTHHSADEHEASSNFGGVLPWWDRLFRSYRNEPALGHAGMTIGIAGVRDGRVGNFAWLLWSPFAIVGRSRLR
jgi:sterol desaturase/sphingolipid hydroxylase (fatty acid hydroxylase superfamily)